MTRHKKYFESYTEDEIAQIKLTAVPENKTLRVQRAQTLGEIIQHAYEWSSTFLNDIAKPVDVADGVTPSFKNRKKIPNHIYFIANDDGVVQNQTIRAEQEISVPIVNLVQSEFWNRFGVAVGDLSQEEEALDAIQHSYDVTLDIMGWALVKAAKDSDIAVDRSSDASGSRTLTVEKLEELIAAAEDIGYGDVAQNGTLFLNAKRFGQLRQDARKNQIKLSEVFSGSIRSMPSTASAGGDYGAHLTHAEVYLKAPGMDVARDYRCLSDGRVILTEDSEAHDNSYKMGIKSISRRALAIVNAKKIVFMKMHADLNT